MTHRGFGRRLSFTTRLVITLIIASLAALVLPASLTGSLSGLLQIFAPVQELALRTFDRAAETFESKPIDDAWQTDRTVAALRYTLQTLAAENAALRRDNQRLTGIRDRGMGLRGRLIPARVIATDSLDWRDSVLLLRGVRRGAERGQGVLSNRLTVDLPVGQGAANGLAVLAAEVLVGVVDQAGPFTSRVRLLSDPATRMSVTIGRFEDSEFIALDALFWLVGRGNGRIEIHDVHHHYITSGAIQVGDVVLTRPDENILPPFVTIGTIKEIYPEPNASLVYVLRVESGIEFRNLRRVFVADTNGPSVGRF